jgi:hypothetical protein
MSPGLRHPEEEQKDSGGCNRCGRARRLSVRGLWRWGITSAQDSGQAKYTVRVPNGLAFSEFRGYEGWQTVAISQNEKLNAVILGNPVMIKAYQSGIPGNGKPFPDGSKMAKIHWNPKKTRCFPTRRCPPACMTSISW